MIFDLISWACILFGSCLLIIGAIGLLRLPDVFSRIHAAGIIDTMGFGGIIIGMAIHAGITLVTVKLLIILLFIFFASPTSTHALAKAALDGGVKPKVKEDRRSDQRRLGAEE